MRAALVATSLAVVLALQVTPAGAADPKMAVILLHGGNSSGSQFWDVRPALEKAGYHTVTPDMCWSQSRRYDKTPIDCMADVDKWIDRLKAEGYERIVLGGHSQGGINAILYAAYHSNLAGLIAMAPSGPPTGDDGNLNVRYAHELIRQGRGDDEVDFAGGINEIHATPNVYLSYVGMESPLFDLQLLPKITAPILWVAGTNDRGQANAPGRYKVAPPNPLNSFVVVEADHFETPDVAVGEVIKWLDRLSEAKGQG
jgi:pimeloyl-ACP methyl ester carboxylesterase